MKVQFSHRGQHWEADLASGVDLSVPVATDAGVRAWGLGRPEIVPHRQGDFVGSVGAGAPVNFNDIRFNPHAHGTHTECLGHITREMESVLAHPPEPWMMARLVSVVPARFGDDAAISRQQLEQAIGKPDTEALVLRTLPNPPAKRNREYSGTNPPYLLGEAALWLNGQGVRHLLLDLPSVDREEDGGALAGHRAFWGLPDRPRPYATITELVYIPQDLEDGLYVLNLQLGPFVNDASPSRPLLFPAIPVGNSGEKEGGDALN